MVYSFRLRAQNSIGWSDYSNLLLDIGFIGLPAQPSTPVRLDQLSDKTSIVVKWDSVADAELPAGLTTGYRLYMAQGPSG